VRSDGGKRIIKVYNKGKAIANRVIVVFPESDGFQILSNPCPIDIRPHNGIDIFLVVFNNVPDKINIQFEWEDNFKDRNSDSQTIQL
jgi:hypothetical protein